LSKATPEERKQMEAQQREMQKKMEQASPEQRAAMAQDFHIMKDVGAIVKQLQPSVAGAEALNRVLTTVDVLSAMAECPSFESLTTAIKNLEPDQAKAVVRAFITLEQALLSHATAADAEALRAVKTKPEKKRPLLLLLWALYQHKIGDAVVLDDMMVRAE
jgi:NifU-like protein involved in Fe-S cluster formation